MPTEFAVLGAGAWGTAIALVLAEDTDHRVTLWSARPENAAILQQKRENVRLLPGVPIPPSILLTTDIHAVAGAELLVVARWVQTHFNTARVRVYTNLDVVGVELAGALKNIIGIAAGISDGLGFGDNTKAALLTRGLTEIARFGVALGAESQTFWGLAGMGDLITTSFSRHGRNRHVGERLAKGEKMAGIVAG